MLLHENLQLDPKTYRTSLSNSGCEGLRPAKANEPPWLRAPTNQSTIADSKRLWAVLAMIRDSRRNLVRRSAIHPIEPFPTGVGNGSCGA
jgi:hypothetical protein